MPRDKKYIGLDLGSVTCGVSRSDTGRLAQPVRTIRFHPDDYDEAIDKILELFEEEKPDLVVMGYPLLQNDDEGPRAKLSREHMPLHCTSFNKIERLGNHANTCTHLAKLLPGSFRNGTAIYKDFTFTDFIQTVDRP